MVVNAWQLDQKSNDANYNITKATLAKLVKDKSDNWERKKAVGREKTLVALGVIEKQVDILLKAGIDTNVFIGTIEQIDQKLGTTQCPELAEAVAVLRIAIIEYGSAISDVFPTPAWNYQDLFPFPKVGSTREANLMRIEGTIKGTRPIIAMNQGLFYVRYLGCDGAKFIANREFELPYLITDPIEFVIKKLPGEGYAQQGQRYLDKLFRGRGR